MLHPSQLLTACSLLVLGCAGANGEATPADGTTFPSGGSAGNAGNTNAAGSLGISGMFAAGGAAGSAVGGRDVGGESAEMAGGGGSAAGSSGGATGGASGGSGGQAITTPIDYSIWQLQLPIGSGTSPTTIKPAELMAGFKNAYFYVADDGGQVFMDPKTGITTSGSAHCRTEMREMTLAGSAAAWPSSGTNTLTVSGQVLLLGDGSSGNVAVAQVFNSDAGAPLCELQYSGSRGGFQLFYEEAKGAGQGTTDLKTPVALKTRYSFTLSLSNGVLTASVNGKQVYSKTPPEPSARLRLRWSRRIQQTWCTSNGGRGRR
jgi:hypothetical protein